MQYPMSCGTVRDDATQQHRSLVRFDTCGQDCSQEPADTPLPAAVASGIEPFMVAGAMAGG